MMGCRQGMPPSLAVLLNSKGFLCMSRTSKILLEGPTLLNVFSGRVPDGCRSYYDLYMLNHVGKHELADTDSRFLDFWVCL